MSVENDTPKMRNSRRVLRAAKPRAIWRIGDFAAGVFAASVVWMIAWKLAALAG